MSRPRFSTAAALPSTSVPNATGVHIQRPKPEKIRTGGLHSIAATGKAYPGTDELVARLKSERLELATSSVPVRNSTMRGDPYTCPELRTSPYRQGSADASSLPSRTSFRPKQPA